MKKEEIQNRILEESYNLFKKHGIHFVTMDLIARRLGMSKKTLYVYFGSKEDILLNSMQKRNKERKEQIESIFRSTDNIIEGLITMMQKISREIGEINPVMFEELERYYPKILKLVAKNRVENIDQITKLLRQGQNKGLILANLNIDIISKLLLGQVELIMNHELFPSPEYPRNELFNHMYISFVRGISTAEGQKIISDIMEK